MYVVVHARTHAHDAILAPEQKYKNKRPLPSPPPTYLPLPSTNPPNQSINQVTAHSLVTPQNYALVISGQFSGFNYNETSADFIPGMGV